VLCTGITPLRGWEHTPSALNQAALEFFTDNGLPITVYGFFSFSCLSGFLLLTVLSAVPSS
jgi:hypothetical protein